MYAKLYAATVHGIDGLLVTVEVDISNGLPHFELVGLGGSAVKEARDRVRSALRNAGYEYPLKRITVNLAPADVRKDGSAFDLAIALGVLIASEQMKTPATPTLILGELALDGSLRPVPGVLPMALSAHEHGFDQILLPEKNQEEAALAGLTVLSANHLKMAVKRWSGENNDTHTQVELIETASDEQMSDPQHQEVRFSTFPSKKKRTFENAVQTPDFCDVIGQHFVKRGLEVAAAGMHNVILIGPPGSGKTMLATCLPSIMPELNIEESFAVTKIYSIAGQLRSHGGLIRTRPLRSPHHTISQSALAGGGNQIPRPGECSLAHSGILFLDEMPEFSRAALEVLRQPLESGEIIIGRSKQTYTYPARFLLLGSMNPCPCGYYGSKGQQECTCTPQQIQRYRSRLSGPLLDRIDIHLEVPRISIEEISSRRISESSVDIRKRVEKARLIQLERYPHRKNFSFNSTMSGNELRAFGVLEKEGRQLMELAFKNLGLSARGYDRIIRVARTIADLDFSEKINSSHVAEAIQYRSLDYKI
ncbi:YifB family Mg chelatase-like AAA ATPase [Brevibacillus daliensis]|uniref:YifB family Mg chelatase-like AAA ATPase n=1 Tax=Brevibacillus daliensis TaxID=2892995 RepID=UPI001E48CF83|nr:YifB family Mg chelatase-like AAA ATPase [Brevibacillus daliensis]